jgi:ethanolamine utilization protein
MENLIDEILKAVESKLQSKMPSNIPDEIPKILLITRLDHCKCRTFLQGEEFKDKCIIDVPEPDADYSVDDYDEIVIRDLDLESISKLTSGMFDSPYLKKIGDCILRGKKITVVQEDLDTFKYRESAPKAFLAMFDEKLATLKEWGFNISAKQQILDRLSKKKVGNTGFVLEKKVITEADVMKAYNAGYKIINTCSKAIFTDIAKEYVERHNIEVITK